MPRRSTTRPRGNGPGWGGPAKGAGSSRALPLRPEFSAEDQPAPEAKTRGWVKKHEAEALAASAFAKAATLLAERLERVAEGEAEASLGELAMVAEKMGNRAFGSPKSSMEIDDRRSADDLSDAELAAIARGSGDGAAEAEGDPPVSH